MRLLQHDYLTVTIYGPLYLERVPSFPDHHPEEIPTLSGFKSHRIQLLLSLVV